VSHGHLRLDCLGAGYAFSRGSYWSGFLLNERVLLDCPPQALVHLYRLGKTAADIDLVLLSHAHTDHIGGMDHLLLDAVYRQKDVRGKPFAVGAPPGMYDRLHARLGETPRLPVRDDPYIEWFEQKARSSFEWMGTVVDLFEMEHAPDLYSLGYRVTIDGAVVSYTGDTVYGEHLLELAEGARALIAECGGDVEHGHMNWDDLRRLRKELPRETELLVTHYDPRTVPIDLGSIEGLTLADDFGVYEYSATPR
jgi:ribonuclease BN (tRNA processing enzyme)